MRWLGLIVVGVIMGAPLPAISAPCTLLRVEKRDEARHIVFFTKFPGEDKTEGRYKSCKLVRTKVDGTETFLVTPFRPDANLVVHPSNWPR